MIRATLAILMAAALTLAAVSAADASRRPTASEQRAFDRLTGLPSGCANVRVSTVSSRWATFTGAKRWGRCEKWGSDGVTVLRKTAGKWRTGIAGSELTCPLNGVPRSVQIDLQPCYAWRVNDLKARDVALDLGRRAIDAQRQRMGAPLSPPAMIDGCEYNADTEIVCTLTAEPIPVGADGVACQVDVAVTADRRGNERGKLVEPVYCRWVEHI